MSNLKNSTVQPIAQTSNAPTVPVITPAATEKVAPTPQTAKPANVQEVFERLKVGNQKQKMYEEFSAKLENVKTFREKFDGGGLVMLIQNPVTKDEINISNLDLILSTIDKSIKMGNDVKERIEIELMQIGI